MLFLYTFCAFVSFSQTDPEKCGAVQLRQQLFTVTRFDGSEPGCSAVHLQNFRSFYIYINRARLKILFLFAAVDFLVVMVFAGWDARESPSGGDLCWPDIKRHADLAELVNQGLRTFFPFDRVLASEETQWVTGNSAYQKPFSLRPCNLWPPKRESHKKRDPSPGQDWDLGERVFLSITY